MISVHAKRELSSTASRISLQVAAEIRRVHEEAASRASAEARRKELEAEREEKEARRLRMAIAKRMPFAKRGLGHLLEIGPSADIQKIILALRSRHTPLVFYENRRPEGDGWAKVEIFDQIGDAAEVKIAFTAKELSIHCSSGIASPKDDQQIITWEVPYSPEEPQSVTRRAAHWDGRHPSPERVSKISLDEFFEEISTETSCNMGAIAHFYQRTYEWRPTDVAFQLLVSCGRKTTFEKYLLKCLNTIRL